MTNEGDIDDALALITYSPTMLPIEIDFSQEIGVLVFLGWKPNISYDIEIKKIVLPENENRVNIITDFDLSGDEPYIPAGEEVI